MDAPIQLARRLVPSVAFLEASIPQSHPSAAVLGSERFGVAVAVAEDRFLTAHYLVLGAESVRITCFGGKPRAARRLSLHHESGLALLFSDQKLAPPVSLSPPGSARPGLPVFLLTQEMDRARRGATGHITSVQPFEAFWEYMLDSALITTAVNPGLAGAPLFDLAGRLLGVVSLGLASVGRYSLAIPADLFREHREELETGLSRGGRAWVGFYPQVVDGSVVLTGVVPGGPADLAGLVKGDLILSIEGSPVSNLRELYTTLWQRHPGEPIGLKLLREAQLLDVTLRSEDRYQFYR